MQTTIEILLKRWRDGDHKAGEQVVEHVYADLRRLAAFYFRQEAAGHTLQPTALVHEVFMRLCAGRPVEWENRAHFFAVAARQMRRILVDHARRRKALKRRDTLIPVSLTSRRAGDGDTAVENLLHMHEALERLEGLDSRAARVVELRVFGGLSESEIATALGISIPTVKRDWTFAKAWLRSRLRE
jgi:RNA polymerase sigma factor (TIGR02999 family)